MGCAWLAGAPFPQSKPTSTGKIVAWVFGGILVAVLVICGGCVGLNLLAAGWFESAAITGANSPTVTPGPGFSALVPGPGCGTAGWDAPSTQSSSDVQCGTNSLLMKEPVTAQYLTEVDWTSPYAYANYSAWVTVGALSQGSCGGLGFQGAISYTGYVCANGTWYVVSYDSTGSPHQQAVGVTTIETSYQLETTVTSSSLVFSINSTQVATVALTGGGEVDAIVLDLYNDAGEDGSGTFSNFIYTPA